MTIVSPKFSPAKVLCYTVVISYASYVEDSTLEAKQKHLLMKSVEYFETEKCRTAKKSHESHVHWNFSVEMLFKCSDMQ